MASNDYHFVTRWRVKGTTTEVSDLLSEVDELTRWWPSVYLDVRVLEPGDANGVGKQVELLTRGWLPYKLRWRFVVTEANKPHGFALRATGDFNGRGEWRFEQNGEWVDITYDWRIRANKPLLRRLSLLLKPIFAANHRWAMRQGERSLVAEIARRQQSNHANQPSS